MLVNSSGCLLRLSACDVAYDFKPVLKNLHITINPGDSIGIKAPSGQGKSTLLRVIADLQPSSGQRIVSPLIHNHPHSALYLPAQAYLLDQLSVMENMILGALQSNTPYDRAYIQAQIYAKTLEIDSLLTKKAGALSAGQKQRVAVIRLLLQNPTIVCLDEPTSHLDTACSQLLMNLLQSYLEAASEIMPRALVIATHDEKLFSWCNKRYILHEGALHEAP